MMHRMIVSFAHRIAFRTSQAFRCRKEAVTLCRNIQSGRRAVVEMNCGRWSNSQSSRWPVRNVLVCGFIANIATSLGLKEPSLPDDVVTKIKLGILYMDRGDHEQADKILHEAIEQARQEADDKAEDYALVILADNAMNARKLEQAEALYKEILRRILAKGATEDDESVVELSLQLATIYAENDDYEKADEGFQFCITKQKKKVEGIDMKREDLSEEEKNSLALYGMILDWFSKYCQKRKDLKLAQNYAQQAVDISLVVLGESDEQTLVLQSDLAVIMSDNGQLKEAIDLLKMVVEKATAIQSPNLGTFFLNLGLLFLRKEDGQNSQYCCKRALKIGEDSHNSRLRDKSRKCIIRSARYSDPEQKLLRED